MVANILTAYTPFCLDPGGGVKMSNSTFSEYGHVTYQINGNDACSNMV